MCAKLSNGRLLMAFAVNVTWFLRYCSEFALGSCSVTTAEASDEPGRQDVASEIP